MHAVDHSPEKTIRNCALSAVVECIFLGFGFWAPQASLRNITPVPWASITHAFELAGTAKGSWASYRLGCRYWIRSSSWNCELAAVPFIIDSQHERWVFEKVSSIL